MSRLKRIRRGIRELGFWRFVLSKSRRAFNKRFRKRLYAWRWQPGDPLYEHADEVQVRRYTSTTGIPLSVVETLSDLEGDGFRERLREEFSEGGVLWIAFVDGLPAAYQWSRRGDCAEEWYVELRSQDVLIYATVTLFAFRGRRIASAVMSHICRVEVPLDGCAFVDCAVWNEPSIRYIQRTGFQKIGRFRTLRNHPE